MDEPSDLALFKSLLAEVDGDEIGLLFGGALAPSGYDQTPAGCLAFAFTGGDGVHFSLYEAGHGISDDSPVVMTVPMARQPNRIVGRNLRHFLGLGLHSGFFILEQLQYDFDGTVERLQRREWEECLSDQGRLALSAAAKALQVNSWADYRDEFLMLEKKASHLLHASD